MERKYKKFEAGTFTLGLRVLARVGQVDRNGRDTRTSDKRAMKRGNVNIRVSQRDELRYSILEPVARLLYRVHE